MKKQKKKRDKKFLRQIRPMYSFRLMTEASQPKIQIHFFSAFRFLKPRTVINNHRQAQLARVEMRSFTPCLILLFEAQQENKAFCY